MLEISSNIVGLKFKPYSTEVQWRYTTNYAASVGDANEWYLDDTKEEGIIAPPMFAVTITWPLVERINEYLEWPYSPDLLRTIVHYSEHLQYERPIRPGDRLDIHGEIAAVLPHRAGTYLVLKFRAVSETGETVFTEYTGGMLRGVKCADLGRGAEALPWLAPLAIPENPIWTTSIPIPRELPYLYDGCANIVFPIHTSPRFARTAGLPDIILQGTATLALAVRELVRREGNGDPRRVIQLVANFGAMVIPDSNIELRLLARKSIGDSIELAFEVLNQNGEGAVHHARLLLNK